MTAKEEAHQLLDQLPDTATWDEVLGQLTRAVRFLPASRPAGVARQREAVPSARELELRRFLEDEIWPRIPADVLGEPLTREEREAILGYGPAGV